MGTTKTVCHTQQLRERTAHTVWAFVYIYMVGVVGECVVCLKGRREEGPRCWLGLANAKRQACQCTRVLSKSEIVTLSTHHQLSLNKTIHNVYVQRKAYLE